MVIFRNEEVKPINKNISLTLLALKGNKISRYSNTAVTYTNKAVIQF